MRHADHRAKKQSNNFRLPLTVFAAQRGAHSRSHVLEQAPVLNIATNNGAVVSLSAEVARKLDEVAPLSRRAMRLAARAQLRRKNMVMSASLLTLAGTAATAIVLAQPRDLSMRAVSAAGSNGSYQSVQEPVSAQVSRSAERGALVSQAKRYASVASPVESNGTEQATSSSQNSTWNLGSQANLNVSELSRSNANNPVVASLIDKDADNLPQGFNPNHETGDVGNAYAFSQCTWWVYLRRKQLGLPVGSHMGNGNMWASSAIRLGYWVDNTVRHVGDVMVFKAGQAGSDAFYGHVAIVEKINADGSIETSECGAALGGKTYSRTFAAKDLAAFQFIHY